MPSVALDLRSTAKCGIANDPQLGMGLFIDSNKLWIGPWQWHRDLSLGAYWGAPSLIDPLSGNYIDLGSDPGAPMRLSARREFERRMGYTEGTLPDSNLADILAHYVLGSLADPTGRNRVKPLRMGRRGLKLHLGGFGLVLEEQFSRNHPNFDATLAVRMADYDRNDRAGVPLEVLEKWTGHDMLKYHGRRGDDLLPQYVPDEYIEAGHKHREPSTTITDNFNRANQSGLGTSSEGWSWAFDGAWSISGNEALGPGAAGSADQHVQAATDLSSDDHYAQIDYTANGGSVNSRIGPAVRVRDVDNSYFAWWREASSGDKRIRKIIAGTISDVATGTEAFPGFPVNDLKLEIDGDSLTFSYSGGTLLGPSTDSSLSGDLRTGLGGAGDFTADNFEGADQAAAAGVDELTAARQMGAMQPAIIPTSVIPY